MKKMERILQSLIWLVIISTVFLVSCQNEDFDVNTGVNAETLNKNSNLTGLLSRASMLDASADNVIDSTSCFKVKLPVNIVINDEIPFQVNSEEDYATVHELLQVATGYGSVDFVFPVTVIFPDYSEEVIVNQQQFNSLSVSCNQSNEPIGCVSIQYPITIFGYDSNFQLAQTYAIDSDLELFLFLLNLNANEYYAVDFPISILNENGQVISVNSNSQLETLIQQAIENCNEPPVFECGNYSPFFQAYDSIRNTVGQEAEQFTMDTAIHAYRFQSNVSGTICSIGYKGDEAATPVVYLIEILGPNELILYEGEHTFSSSQIEYVSIPPVQITSNVAYTMRRTLAINAASNGIGTVLMPSEGPNILPFVTNQITILDSDFGFGEVTYFALPLIDFKFVPN